MSDFVVANRYASALLAIGIEKNQLSDFVDDIKLVQEVIQETPNLQRFLVHPSISDEAKLDCIQHSFSQLSEHVIHMLSLLVLRNRTDLLDQVLKGFLQLAYDEQNIGELYITSAEVLTEEQLEAVINQFKQKLHKETIHSIVEVNPKLIGGVKVRHKNTVYDGTILNKLQRLESSIRTVNY